MISEFLSRAFAARDVAHREHLRTNSYAKHMALGDFYARLIDTVDTIAEVYNGEFDLIPSFPVEVSAQGVDIVAYLKREAAWLEKNREDIAEGSDAIENQLDELAAIYYQTLYKLTRLQ